jgi:eukaryotic-like serine/threonine-protein kinase
MADNADKDERVMAVVSIALRRSSAERESYLRLACENDESLYKEAVELVKRQERLGSFLEHPLINDHRRPFEIGEVISDRFEILREIGEGGMGFVYEAFDRKRNQRIAIKAAKPGFHRLLSPELQGALQVRHRNVCLVNEIHTSETAQGGIDFLTMELLEGETLAAHLIKCERLPSNEALEIASQICSGLAAAHDSGVVHRDLKPGNIMLCQAPEKGLRVVIMDFGLAGAVSLDANEGGTPGYMAPELSKGEKACIASDMYSLGVVLYEIVAGQLPTQEPSSNPTKPSHFAAPSRFNEGINPSWDGVIVSCLDESPAHRPSDARKVIAVLEKKPLRKAPLVAAALLVVSVLAIPQVRGWLSDRIWPPPNVRLAILPFDGATNGEDIHAGVLQDISDRIKHMTSGRRSLIVIPPSELADRRIQTPDQARDVLHATHVLQTKLRNEGGEVVAHGEVIDLATKSSLREFTGRYSSDTIGTMPAAFAGSVSLALGLHGPATAETLSSAATPAYDRGLDQLRRDEESFDEAIASFNEAARLDPRSALPLAGLVEAKVMKSDQLDKPDILEDARRDLDAAESLSPDSSAVRLAAGLLKETEGQYEEALDDYRRVLDREPQNVDALRSIAEVYDKLKMPSQAIAAYQKAIQLDPENYAGYHGLGVFYYYHGDYSQAAEQFQKAIERAPGLFDEYTNLGAALDDSGRDAEAERALLTSLRLHETPRALNSMGAMRAYQKRDEEAVGYYKRAVAMDPTNYIYLVNLADSERRLGRLRDADAAYSTAMDIALSALEQDPRKGSHRGFIAYIKARLGDRKRAESEIAQALQMSKGETKVIRNAVLTYEVLGERDRAIQVLSGAKPELLQELAHQPDLSDFRRDSRFKQLEAENSKGGK